MGKKGKEASGPESGISNHGILILGQLQSCLTFHGFGKYTCAGLLDLARLLRERHANDLS
jgi:hypothetical protein